MQGASSTYSQRMTSAINAEVACLVMKMGTWYFSASSSMSGSGTVMVVYTRQGIWQDRSFS